MVSAAEELAANINFGAVSAATELKKHGDFVPGVRPGSSTADHLRFILIPVWMDVIKLRSNE